MNGAVITAWRQGHWFSLQWEVDAQVTMTTNKNADDEQQWQVYDSDENISSQNGENGFLFSTGGFQGGESDTNPGEWWIENIYEELDAPNEWYLLLPTGDDDTETPTLFYFYNASAGTHPPSDTSIEAVVLEVLVNVTGISMNDSLNGVTIRGIQFADAAQDILLSHGTQAHQSFLYFALSILYVCVCICTYVCMMCGWTQVYQVVVIGHYAVVVQFSSQIHVILLLVIIYLRV